MPTSILIAGASGSIGYDTLKLARSDGHRIRVFSRGRARLDSCADQVVTGDGARSRTFFDDLCSGIDVLISAQGAGVSPGSPDKTSYREVDTVINPQLLNAARAAGVRRVVHVSLHVEPGYAGATCVKAHEDVVDAIRDSGLDSGIFRPTGVFSALRSLLDMARQGFVRLVGSGDSKTNPVGHSDVAELIRTAPGLLRGVAKLMKPWNPRMAEITRFVAAVSTHDCGAPTAGVRRLENYFRQEANW